jgi:hypothetical protein
MNIYAINTEDYAGSFEAFFTFGEIDMPSLAMMVNNAIAKAAAGDGEITNLYIYDHGVWSGGDACLNFGSDAVANWSWKKYEQIFRTLGYYFAERGSIFLMHCYGGADPKLMRSIAQATGARVVGGTDTTVAGIDYNFGKMRVCLPSGRCYIDVRNHRDILSGTW